MGLPIAAYGAVVSASGVSTVNTNEPCAFVSGADPNKVYQVTNTAKRVWDPSVAIVVQDGGVTVAANLYSFNYLFGIIKFVGHTVTGAITVSTGNYLPIVESVLASKFDLSAKQTLIDTTNFDSGGAVFRTAGLVGYEGSLSVFEPLNTVLDGASGTWQTWLLNSTPKLLDLQFGAGLSRFRTWILPESEKTSAAVAGAITGDVSWKSIVELGLAGFGWGL